MLASVRERAGRTTFESKESTDQDTRKKQTQKMFVAVYLIPLEPLLYYFGRQIWLFWKNKICIKRTSLNICIYGVYILNTLVCIILSIYCIYSTLVCIVHTYTYICEERKMAQKTTQYSSTAQSRACANGQLWHHYKVHHPP